MEGGETDYTQSSGSEQQNNVVMFFHILVLCNVAKGYYCSMCSRFLEGTGSTEEQSDLDLVMKLNFRGNKVYLTNFFNFFKAGGPLEDCELPCDDSFCSTKFNRGDSSSRLTMNDFAEF